MLEVIKAYALKGPNMERAAHSLHMNRDTLGYRPIKIEQTIGIGIDSMDTPEIFRLEPSCILLSVQNDDE